jgi:hypothetical protein
MAEPHHPETAATATTWCRRVAAHPLVTAGIPGVHVQGTSPGRRRNAGSAAEWAAASPSPGAENQNQVAAIAQARSEVLAAALVQKGAAPKDRRIRHRFHPPRTHRRSTAPASAALAPQAVVAEAQGPEPVLNSRSTTRRPARRQVSVQPQRQVQAPVPMLSPAARARISPDPSGVRLNRQDLRAPVPHSQTTLAAPAPSRPQAALVPGPAPAVVPASV